MNEWMNIMNKKNYTMSPADTEINIYVSIRFLDTSTSHIISKYETCIQ